MAACGVYVIVQYASMVRSRTIRQNMLLPKDLDVTKCRDVEGYIRFIGTKQLVFGIASLAAGVAGLIQDVIGIYNLVVSLGLMAVFLIFCIWFGSASKQASEKFW